MALPRTPPGFAVLGVVLLVVAYCFVYGGRELLTAYQVYANAPDAVVDTPAGGRFELQGTADPDERTVTAPFTGTACLVCEFEVQEERNTQNGTTWETVAEDVASVPFRLVDDTGSVLVDPRGARFALTREERTEVRGGTAPPERIRSFIERTDEVDSENTRWTLGPLSIKTGQDRRYVERRLDPGETVHVLGYARHDTTASERAGEVNAVVGAPRARDGDREGLLGRFFRQPFVVTDADERTAAWRIAKPGLLSVGIGLVVLVVLGYVLVAVLPLQ